MVSGRIEGLGNGIEPSSCHPVPRSEGGCGRPIPLQKDFGAETWILQHPDLSPALPRPQDLCSPCAGGSQV